MKKIILFLIAILLLVTQGAKAEMSGAKMTEIKIVSGDKVILAKLNNTSTAQDLIAKLPIKLKMNPHQNREYYANINLDKTSATQDGYKIGDIGYWVSGNSLVLFYDKGYTNDLIIMGNITDGLDKLSKINGSFQATIEIIKD